MADLSKFRGYMIDTIEVHPEKSRLEFGGAEVSFHCDKFNTRVVKGLEDVVGFNDANRILASISEKSHYDLLTTFLNSGDAADDFASLSPEDKVASIFEIYKVFAYGSFDSSGIGESGGIVTSGSSYVAEGWLENMERWNWELRGKPVCHDACGHIAAAVGFAYGKPAGTYTVTETKCRSMGDDLCEFKVEVK
jgi:hypothetical protein